MVGFGCKEYLMSASRDCFDSALECYLVYMQIGMEGGTCLGRGKRYGEEEEEEVEEKEDEEEKERRKGGNG